MQCNAMIPIHRIARFLFYVFDLTLQCLQYKVSMLTNSGGILFKNMAAQNIDVNIISGLSTINEADLNSMLNEYWACVNDEVQEQPDTKCCTHYLRVVYFPNQIIIATPSMN